MALWESFEFDGLMKYFEAISAIPRASYKEEKIADYICEFAKARGLEYYRDDANNVLINSPATAGCEGIAPLLLQGHTDMVCEKNEGVEHNFDTDALELYEEDGWIRAKGTTLGADDGVAVATMLYVLDGGVERHGPLQCLFTASEEVGLDGVKAFDYSRIFARKMINMDSAEEEQIIAGCAGGQRSSMTFTPTAEEHTGEAIRVRLKGLFGGHSGEDINKGRANANKLMGHALYRLLDEGTHLVSVHGGTKDNAIPRECEALLLTDNKDALMAKVEEISAELSVGLCDDDKGFTLGQAYEGTKTLKCVDRATAEAVVFVMHTADNGIFEMNHGIEGIVEWSRNLGIVSCDVEGAEIVFSTRSSYTQRLDCSEAQLDSYARMTGAQIRHYNRYPGWSYAAESAVREEYVAAFESLYGHSPEITVIHAGLECGFISEAVEGMDIISCGANVKDLHSPDERLEKASFERFFKVIKKVIEA